MYRPWALLEEDQEREKVHTQKFDEAVQAALLNRMILPGLTNKYTNSLWTGITLDKKLYMIKIGEFNGSDNDWL